MQVLSKEALVEHLGLHGAVVDADESRLIAAICAAGNV